MREFRFIAVLLCVLTLVTGCQRRPLIEPDHRGVLNVKINYSNINHYIIYIYDKCKCNNRCRMSRKLSKNRTMWIIKRL